MSACAQARQTLPGAAGLIAYFGVPRAHTKWEFAVWYCIMGFADGIALVGTPTLMRDFTPQAGRATAMGVNTLGTGASALLISFFATRLLAHTTDWRVMLHLVGGACLVTFVVLLFTLRELPPHLRGQVVARAADEDVLEQATSAGDDEKVLAVASQGWAKWRTVLTPRIISANLAIMFYLVIFITASGFLTLYNVEVQHLSLSQANNLGTLYWGVNCVALVSFGIISDRLMVRKPVMIAGALIVVVQRGRREDQPGPGRHRLRRLRRLQPAFLGHRRPAHPAHHRLAGSHLQRLADLVHLLHRHDARLHPAVHVRTGRLLPAVPGEGRAARALGRGPGCRAGSPGRCRSAAQRPGCGRRAARS